MKLERGMLLRRAAIQGVGRSDSSKGQCHCRECQYISGGGPNMIFGFPESGFEYTTGQQASFSAQ